MNKSQGLLAGALLAVALLLRPAGAPSPQTIEVPGAGQSTPASPQKTSTKSGVRKEGPWLASCSYWAAVRHPLPDEDPTQPDSFHVSAHEPNLTININSEQERPDPGCGPDISDRWGLPQSDKALPDAVHVTAIIATVPDPVHTHLAMTFDRTVDVLLQAAEDNGYLSSYFWLPWNRSPESLKPSMNAGNKEPGHDPLRERQPGLIVLKKGNGFADVIFLFLVSESPYKGVDGFQLQNTFAGEAELSDLFNSPKMKSPPDNSSAAAKFDMGESGVVSIIGPEYTSSSAALHAGIVAAVSMYPVFDGLRFHVYGATATGLSHDLFNSDPRIDFLSFSSEAKYTSQRYEEQLVSSGYSLARAAHLLEAGTAYAGGAKFFARKNTSELPLELQYPREISLLRNAEVEGEGVSGGGSSGNSVPTPYLHFSAKDSSPQDTLPQFSREHSPLSQEAQLMTIARRLRQADIQVVTITASNILDEIFLAGFLHRADPDVQILFDDDLLMARDIDNLPFVGSISIAPYPLMSLTNKSLHGRVYTDHFGAASYNAASYTFFEALRNRELKKNNSKEIPGPFIPDPGAEDPTTPAPNLLGYGNILGNAPAKGDAQTIQPSLWASVVGKDGYYPLGILSSCASDDMHFAPRLGIHGKTNACRLNAGWTCIEHECLVPGEDVLDAENDFKSKLALFYPSDTWNFLAVFVSLLCLMHAGMLFTASFWSPLTRDLAIHQNDQPRRRFLYIHASSAALVLMSFVTAFPLIALHHLVPPLSWTGKLEGYLPLAWGLLVIIVTVWVSFKERWPSIQSRPAELLSPLGWIFAWVKPRLYFLLAAFCWTVALALALCWVLMCTANDGRWSIYLEGLSFSLRCVHPENGVSPLLPADLLLLGWFFWGFLQTRRMRFSEQGRPYLWQGLKNIEDRRFVVSDSDLNHTCADCDSLLYENVTCFFIIRKVINRLASRRLRTPVDIVLVLTCVAAFAVFLFPGALFQDGGWFRSLDHPLWLSGKLLASPFELFLSVLFFPLLWVSLASWVRLLFIWSSLKTGLLKRLEDQPIRFAFTRLHVSGWMTMLGRVGLAEQWRDMDRSIESMNQMMHQEDIQTGLESTQWHELEAASLTVRKANEKLRNGKSEDKPHPEKPEFEFMRDIEISLAAFGQCLLTNLLIPYWKNKRIGLVESEVIDELPIKARRSETKSEQPQIPMELHAGPATNQPPAILVAEEFVAIRYMSLTRAVMANMRYCIILFSLTFVLSVVAWNSYPFHPRRTADLIVTGLMLLVGSGMIWVFAQMHRDSILSRITDTRPNELGAGFYLRILSFGALPVITWLAYEFPDAAGAVYKFVQSGSSVFK